MSTQVKGVKSRKFLFFVASMLIIIIFAAFDKLTITLVSALIALPVGYGYINIKQKSFVAPLIQPGAIIQGDPPHEQD